MQATKKDLPKSQIELTVELSAEEFAGYIEKGAQKVAQEVKIEGFRPGKVPYEILKQKIGEMTILEEAAHIAIQKTIDTAVEQNTIGQQAIGQPQVNVTKLAPGNPLEYKVIVSVLPSVALGKYKELKIKEEKAVVAEAELEKSLRDLREMRAAEKIVDRGIENGDKAVVDAHMFLDKVQLEDGHHHGLAVIIGKDYLVPGFDEKLLGAKKGEERKFSLPYPAEHYQKNIAGKMVDFVVKISEVYDRQLPELDDKFAEFFRLKSLEELKKNLRESLAHEKEHKLELKAEAEMLSKIVGDTKFGDLPDQLVESETRNMLSELEQSVIRQGGKFEDYLAHLKKTREELMLEMTPNAVKRAKSALVIREIAIIEKIAPTDADVVNKTAELKERYVGQADILKVLDEPGYASYLRNILTNEQVIAKLKEWNYVPAGDKQKS